MVKSNVIAEPTHTEAAKTRSVEAAYNNANEESTATVQPTFLVSHDEMIHFYNGNDCAKLQNLDIQKVRELQEINDKLQRQVAQIDKDLKQSDDCLTLLAEKERCLIIVARNTGEILKIQIENEKRIERIAKLEAENQLLKEVIVSQRNHFIDSHDLNSRTKHAADFFLTKSQIEKNSAEIADLTQE